MRPGTKRREWTKDDVRYLRAASKEAERVTTVARKMRRTPGALRQKAFEMDIPLGHRRRRA